MTCVRCSCLLRLLRAYVARKNPKDLTLLAAGKLCTVRKRILSNLILKLHPESQKKARAKKHCDLCKKHEGAYMTNSTRDCRWFEKDGMEKSNFRAAKKGGKKPNPTKQSFTQLSKKMDWLEKVIKKKDTKKRKHCSSNSDSDSK